MTSTIGKSAAAALLALALAGLLTGCDNAWSLRHGLKGARAQACFERLEGAVRSPASLKVVGVSDWGGNIQIAYDALNAYGVPIREEASCQFAEDGSIEHFSELSLATLTRRLNEATGRRY